MRVSIPDGRWRVPRRLASRSAPLNGEPGQCSTTARRRRREAVNGLRQRPGSAGVKRIAPRCSTVGETVTIAARARIRPALVSIRRCGPEKSIACDGGAEPHRQAVRQARHIGAEPAGDEEVALIFHAREVLEADLLERPPADEPMHGRDRVAQARAAAARSPPAVLRVARRAASWSGRRARKRRRGPAAPPPSPAARR